MLSDIHTTAQWLGASLVGIGVSIALVAVHVWRRSITNDADTWFKHENIPLVLRDAQLFMSERGISMSQPVPLRGRVDQVFLTRHGLLVLVDTKTRDVHRVYDSDIWQLAVYAAILDVTVKYRLSSYGFIRTVVRTETARSVRYHVVRLPSFRDTIQLAQQENV